MTDVTEVNELGENTELKALNALLDKAAYLLREAENLDPGVEKDQLIESIVVQRASLEAIPVDYPWVGA